MCVQEFLLLWLKHKEEHVPELPLARADLLGAHHHAMPQVLLPTTRPPHTT